MIDKKELIRYIEATRNFKDVGEELDQYKIGVTYLHLLDTSVVITHHSMVMRFRYKDISLVRGCSYCKTIRGKSYSHDGIILYIGDSSEVPILARG